MYLGYSEMGPNGPREKDDCVAETTWCRRAIHIHILLESHLVVYFLTLRVVGYRIYPLGLFAEDFFGTLRLLNLTVSLHQLLLDGHQVIQAFVHQYG
jgi:hypothetical protein